MEIEKANPSKGGDAKPWIHRTEVRIARLPKPKSFLFSFLLLILTVPGGYGQAFAETLSWTMSGQATGYRIHYGENCSDLRNSINVGNVSSYSINSMPLGENKSYCLAVKAYNQSTESPFSNTVYWNSSDNTPPSPPTGVIAQ